MPLADVLLLVSAGLAAGYVAGLIGVGGGVIFAPVLLFYYDAAGVPDAVLPSLTVGTSLLCTLAAAVASAWAQLQREAVDRRMALVVGASSGLAVLLMTQLVTTQPWYTPRVFQAVFGALLLVVVVRMVRGRRASAEEAEAPRTQAGWPTLGGIGSAAGVVSAAAGVGGGVVLVPAYTSLLKLPIHRAVGTSSATIVLIASLGVLTYAASGWGAPVPETALGFVDVGRAALLALPALATARLGVRTAHRVDTRRLRLLFAALAAFVAVRLLWEALG